jgi:hypothetical protein
MSLRNLLKPSEKHYSPDEIVLGDLEPSYPLEITHENSAFCLMDIKAHHAKFIQ